MAQEIQYREIPAAMLGTYRQMTIDTSAVLDVDGFECDPTEAEAILDMVERQHEADSLA